jgi:uncharacterized protein (TIGR02996 family)
MTTTDGLLAAILDRPDDDNPRQVMADWFEEQGDRRYELLRQPGYLELFYGPFVGDATRVYWVTWPNVHTLLGYDAQNRPCQCGRYAVHLSGFGGLKCLQCCAWLAKYTSLSIWDRVLGPEEIRCPQLTG